MVLKFVIVVSEGVQSFIKMGDISNICVNRLFHRKVPIHKLGLHMLYNLSCSDSYLQKENIYILNKHLICVNLYFMVKAATIIYFVSTFYDLSC